MASSAERPRGFRTTPLTGAAAPKFWTHELYRGPSRQPVRILYSRTKMQSEEIAHEFIGESVVGFDMEWPWDKKGQVDVPLQQRVGLIQIATEDKIGLFHIGLHTGTTAKDVLAPTLRKIIESEDITKTGVAILNADFSRLHQWFGLAPRGAFELGHLHNLVTHGATKPARVTTKMRALTKLVEEHLGLPLYKGKVRTSNWSRPLNDKQIRYAAADAYAGVMLYHCMNAKRLSMDPMPPIPLHAETYLPMRPGMGPIIPVKLGTSSKAESGISASEFYHPASTTVDETQTVSGDAACLAEAQDDNNMQNGNVEEQEEMDDESQSGDQTFLAETAPADCDSELLGRADDYNEYLQDEAAADERGGPSRAGDMRLVVVGRLGRQLLLEQRKVVVHSNLPDPRHSKPAKDAAHQARAAPVPKKSVPISNRASHPTAGDSKRLFAELSAHRKRTANDRGCPAFVVAPNATLTAISEACPRTEQELLRIKGIGKAKKELYGPAWLEIVRIFLEVPAVVASDEPLEAPSTPLPTTPVSRRRQPPSATHEASAGGHGRPTPAILHTGMSFSMENATLGGAADHTVITISDDSDEEPAFGSPIRSPSPSTLRKRKRQIFDSTTRPKQRPVLPRTALGQPRRSGPIYAQPARAQAPLIDRATVVENDIMPHIETERASPVRPPRVTPKQIFAPQPAASAQKTKISSESQILRNKLLAFNRRVTSVVVLSEATIELIVQRPPQTAQELLRIPDIMPFANACARQNQCLLTFIKKSTQKTVALGA